jgi:hypothetical protein
MAQAEKASGSKMSLLGEFREAKIHLSLAIQDLIPEEEAEETAGQAFEAEEAGADLPVNAGDIEEAGPADDVFEDIFQEEVIEEDAGDAAFGGDEVEVEISEEQDGVEAEVIEINEEDNLYPDELSRIWERLAGQPRALAQGADIPTDAKIIIWYTLDKSEQPVWHMLDSFSASKMSNALKGGYFEYEAPFMKNWEDVNDLSIKIEGLGDSLKPFVVYLDSLWLEAAFEPADGIEIFKKNSRDKEIELLSGLKMFKADDDEGEFVFRYNKSDLSIIDSLSGFFGLASFWKNVRIDARLLDLKGKEVSAPMVMIMNEDGEFSLKFSELKKYLKPGKYQVEILVEDDSGAIKKIVQEEIDFSWGVLAINFNKSVYGPDDDSSYIQVGVLDDLGNTICDAELEIVITDPTGDITRLGTDDDSIVSNPECGRVNVISRPDYYAYYMLYGEGQYSVNLTASTSNGIKTVSDSFRVAETLPYSVERVGPSRIYPLANYGMKMIFRTEENFKGDIIEELPSQFSIFNFQFSNNISSSAEAMEDKQYPSLRQGYGGQAISNIQTKAKQ